MSLLSSAFLRCRVFVFFSVGAVALSTQGCASEPLNDPQETEISRMEWDRFPIGAKVLAECNGGFFKATVGNASKLAFDAPGECEGARASDHRKVDKYAPVVTAWHNDTLFPVTIQKGSCVRRQSVIPIWPSDKWGTSDYQRVGDISLPEQDFIPALTRVFIKLEGFDEYELLDAITVTVDDSKCTKSGSSPTLEGHRTRWTR